MSLPPEVQVGSGGQIALSGSWTIKEGVALDKASRRLAEAAVAGPPTEFDLDAVEALDTAGALFINRAREDLAAAGAGVKIARAHPEYATLLAAAPYHAEPPAPPRPAFAISFLGEVGLSAATAGRDLVRGVSFLGALVSTFGRLTLRPSRWRMTSFVYQLEKFSWRSAPIIVLINFLVGGIVSQQGIFQLRRFGAVEYVVDLIGVLVLRELGVLLTSIMIAGRCGSAITAEIGSMKMNEEVDAMLVMALDPTETLIVPRVLALVVAMPVLTFIADLSAILGGMLVSAFYGGIAPDVFFYLLQDAVGTNTFIVGLIKAPVMALVIGLIATAEGFAVQGSAESLGSKVTESVVKSIFMVIVVDGLFAMLFAAVRY
jgi:phospholipid/cholesterol/gamma-HCH transport system permease protein